ncbi:MAG TPA: site-specific integrase [Candidatus Atribacteria bacterium]|nr:site-specific integrase [Candidatus Atribacteria bacterium]
MSDRIKIKEIGKEKIKDNISPEDERIINMYLIEKQKKSDHSYNLNKSILYNFFNSVNKRIEKITMKDVRDYFIELDKKELTYNTKCTYRSFISSFFYYFQGLKLNEGKIHPNPVPNKRIWDFNKTNKDIKKHNREKERLSIQEINKILEYCKKNLNTKNKKKYFIYYCFLTFSGARPSEIVSIKVKDINLTERYFETGFEKNARKSTRHLQRALLFFIPKGFIKYLKNYLLINDSEWLIPSNDRYFHSTTEGLNYIRRKILEKKIGIRWKDRWFRRSLITEYTKKGLPDGYREGLLNHVSHSTEWRYYIKLSIKEKRKIFDQYFPYYGKIPYF